MSSNEMPTCASWRKGGSGETGQPSAGREGSGVFGGCLPCLGGSWLSVLWSPLALASLECSTSFEPVLGPSQASLPLSFLTLATTLEQNSLVDRHHSSF